MESIALTPRQAGQGQGEWWWNIDNAEDERLAPDDNSITFELFIRAVQMESTSSLTRPLT